MFPDYTEKRDCWLKAAETITDHEYMSINKFRKEAKILNGDITSPDETDSD